MVTIKKFKNQFFKPILRFKKIKKLKTFQYEFSLGQLLSNTYLNTSG